MRRLNALEPTKKLLVIAVPVLAVSVLLCLLCTLLRSGFGYEGVWLSFISDDGQELQMRDRDGNPLSYMYLESGIEADDPGFRRFTAVTYISQGFIFSSDLNGSVLTFSDGSRVELDEGIYDAVKSSGTVTLGGQPLSTGQTRDWLLYEKALRVRDFRRSAFDGGLLWIALALGCLLAFFGTSAICFPALPLKLHGSGFMPSGLYLTISSVSGRILLALSVAVPVLMLALA